jgi:hypothetical protein
MLLIAFLQLVLTAINIMEFFLLVHLVLRWKKVAWLRSFDTAGNGLVDNFTTLIDRLFYRVINWHLSTKGSLIIGFIVLELARMLIVGIC